MDNDFKRIIPLKEVAKEYPDEAKLAVMFNHEVIEDHRGTWRWRQNKLIDLISDNCPIYLPSKDETPPGKDAYCSRTFTGRASLDLNTLHTDLFNGKFSVEEMMKYSMQTGYSLSGFRELYAQHEASDYKLPGAKTEYAKGQDRDYYIETVIEYMLRVHKGKVLKL